MKNLQNILLAVVLVAFVASCAPVMQSPVKPLDSGSARTVGSKYVPKVDNFQVIIDSSLSMDDAGGPNDFIVAREIVRRFNQGIPTDLSYNGGLRSIGHNAAQSSNPTDLLYGMTSYKRDAFQQALAKIKYTGGGTPMAVALNAAGNDLKSASGKSALVIVSDGLHIDNAPDAAKKLKGMMGANLCIYTVAVGNENNGAGHDMMKMLADIGQCGYATTAAALAGDAKMNAFIDDALVMAAPPKPAPKPAPKPMAPKDSDGDGVTDDKDKCPNTPRGELVDEDGCTLKLTLHINFAHDSAAIKPEFKHQLDKAAAYVQKYSEIPYIVIAGHTDSQGEEEYNQGLSERRAAAVRNYLVENYDVEEKRLVSRGYGELRPVADNKTKEGRYENRRVEIICCSILPPE